MLHYAVKRIALGLLIIIVVMIAMYAAVFLIPGDPASMALGPRATPELKRLLTGRMGLDRPLYVQIFNFFRNAITGNLGYDVWSNRPVSTLVLAALPNTLMLGIASLGWAIAAGVPIGCLSVVRRGTLVDAVIGVASVSVIAIPSFVVAIYSLLLFAVTLRWFPAIGAGESADLGSTLAALVLPCSQSGSAGSVTLRGWSGLRCSKSWASLISARPAPSACRNGASSTNMRSESP